jgi:antitoxin PrlF
MLASTLTIKGQTTIPAEIRHALGLKPGDHLAFEVEDGKIILTKIAPFEKAWHEALSQTLAEEWLSPEDESAYRDL